MKTWLLSILLSLSVGGMPYDERPSARVLSRLRSRCVEGQNFLHPRGGAYYMTCTSGTLRQRLCGVDRVFSVHARQCVDAQAGHHESGTVQVLSSSNINRLQDGRGYLKLLCYKRATSQHLTHRKIRQTVFSSPKAQKTKLRRRKQASPESLTVEWNPCYWRPQMALMRPWYKLSDPSQASLKKIHISRVRLCQAQVDSILQS
ncbi:hypothetical protein MTO96_007039 [Rhipicephalus appendiculatus]